MGTSILMQTGLPSEVGRILVMGLLAVNTPMEKIQYILGLRLFYQQSAD
jgi:hypothetical protein